MDGSPGDHAPYVFLSYASVDREWALRIADLLEANGIAVCIDRKSIAGGTSWSAEIVRGIEECTVLVVLCSAAAMASPNVQQELQLAWEHRRAILPLRLDKTPPPRAIEYVLAGRQWVEVLDRANEEWLPPALDALQRLGLVTLPIGPSETVTADAAPVVITASVPPIGSPSLPALPNPTSPLLGRAEELAAVSGLLRRDSVRLVTLTGAGGSGKTRLALACAQSLVESFPDGVAFVSLAPIGDPDLVLSTIASTLGIRESPVQPLLATMCGQLRERRILLVLDNFEQVLPAAPRLAELLAGCRGLKLLVTSRAALRLSIEQQYPVRSLAVPDPRQPEPLERLSQYPSVELFVARAQAVQPDFTMTNTTAPVIAEICHRLDGLPLAIELAAARVRLMDPAAMLARLARRLPLLTGGARDQPERQRTLRATLDWSYVLLAPAEQRLFARLAVFVDGFSLEAVEAVCSGGIVGGDQILDRLEGLVSQSLVQQRSGSGPEPRFVMLETIREYALERLEASGEIEEVRRSHGVYFLALVEEAEPGLRTGEQDAWANRLEAEYGNVRSVLERSDASGDAWVDLRMSAALWRFWWIHAHAIEGRRWVELALARSASAPPGLRAKVLGAAGALAWVQGDLGRGRTLLEQSLAIRRETNDRPGMAEALNYLANIALQQADFASARSLHGEVLAIRREIGDRWGASGSLRNLGLVAMNQGDATLARALLEEAMVINRELGDRLGIAHVLGDLGWVALSCDENTQARALIGESLAMSRQLGDQAGIAGCFADLGVVDWAEGNYSQARSYLEESLEFCRHVGDMSGVPWILNSLGNVASAEGRYGPAGILYAESLGTRRDQGDRMGIAQCLEGLAGVAAMGDQQERGARLTGAAEALRDAIGAPPIPAERRAFDRTIATLREDMGDDAFEAQRAAGRTMPLDLDIDEALDVPKLRMKS